MSQDQPPLAAPTWYVYILFCRDHTYYTGITTDPDRRLAEHNASAKGARYTRARRPVQLVYVEQAATRAIAARREYRLRRLSPADKRRLIDSRHQPPPEPAPPPQTGQR